MKRGKQVEYRNLTAQVGNLEPSRAINFPESLSTGSLEWQDGVSLRLGKKRTVTVVPPKGAVRDDRLDLATLLEKPSSWLLAMTDDFGELNGKELEVIPSSKKGVVGIRLLRSSGHVIAEGTGRLEGNVVAFELKMRGKGISKKSQPIFRGSVSADKRWRFETTL